jgi:putative CocE/NonD family hydrolase
LVAVTAIGLASIGLASIGLSAIAQGAAPAATVVQSNYFTADDGVKIHYQVGGAGGVSRRPLIVEDSPYAPGCCDTFAGPAYNYVEMDWRGTGLSGGEWATTGERDQRDLSQFLGWACTQPWSDGRIGLYGFSASAIIAYNSMHLPLPCVKAASMMSGTVDLYRDLLYIGGINNTIPGLYVEGAVGGMWLADVPGRTQQQPVTIPTSGVGYVNAPVQTQQHPTEDAYWNDRVFKGDVNHIPILADDGFYDVESRGAFQAYMNTRQDGSHLLVIGAHDGFTGGTTGAFPQYARWFDHYVRGVDNGVNREPAVNLYLAQGSHEQLINGHFTHVTGSDWPLPGTQWTRLYLSPTASGTTQSINDGSLATHAGAAPVVQRYPFAPSDAYATDTHTTATVSGTGVGQVNMNTAATAVPALTDMQAAEPVSLTYTTPPFATPVDAVGPASLDVFLSSTTNPTDIAAVLADVWPDGTAHAVANGQLRTAYPQINAARSQYDPKTGDVVDPYPDFSAQDPAAPLATREYHVEILPIGNHFGAGHRLRLYIVGTSAAMQGAAPGVNSVSVGGVTPSRLLFPTIGSPTFGPAHPAVTAAGGGGGGLPGSFSAHLPWREGAGLLMLAVAAALLAQVMLAQIVTRRRDA